MKAIIGTPCRLAMVAILLACPEPRSDAPTGDVSTPATPAANPVPAVGLDDPSNRSDVVALAQRALACEWINGIEEATCPALGVWTKSTVVQDRSADATLLAMLVDGRDPVRWLAGRALSQDGRAAITDPRSAKRLLDAALGESKPLVARVLGGAVARIDLRATGLEQPVRDVLQSADALVELRQVLASRALEANPELFDAVFHLARTTREPELRSSSVWGLRFAPADKLSQVHDLWLATADDPEVVDEVYVRCAVYTACRAIWDPLLTKLEQKKAASMATGVLLSAMLDATTEAATRARAVKSATRIVEDESQEDVVRGMTLQALADAKEPVARRLAETYGRSEHPDSLLAVYARGILATRAEAPAK